MNRMRLLTRACLPLALFVGLGLAMPEIADARPDTAGICKKRKKRRKKRRRVKVRGKRVTAKKIAKWQRRKVAHAVIVERAQKAGYKVTKRERRKLKRLRVKPTLIAKLSNNTAAPVQDRKAPTAKDYNLDRSIDPNEIDFDSVPPPNGMPRKLAKKQEAEKDKKTLDRSLRPSAPFESDKTVAAKGDKKKRVVFSASN